MRIESIDIKTNFNAKLHPKLKADAERFFISRKLPVQYEYFQKAVEKLECYGEHNSTLLNAHIWNGNSYINKLCLKNKNLNKERAAIIFESRDFSRILAFITNNITDQTILKFEEMLPKL